MVTYVHQAGVDVAELLEAEQSRAMGTVIEDVALSPKLVRHGGPARQRAV